MGIFRFFRQIASGMASFFSGLSLVITPPFLKYLILPALIGTLLFGLTFYELFELFQVLAAVGVDELIPESFQGFARVIAFLLTLGVSTLLSLFLFRFLLSIAILPFLGPLLDHVEAHLTGTTRSTTLGQDIRNLWPALIMGIKATILSLLVAFISLPLGPFQMIPLFLLESLFMGRSLLEPILEKIEDSPKRRAEIASGYRARLLGLGAMTILFLWIPIIGAILSPAAALAGAAILYHRDSRTAT